MCRFPALFCFIVIISLVCIHADQTIYPEGNWGPPYFYPDNPQDRLYKLPWEKGKTFSVNGDYESSPHAGYKHPDYSLDFDMPKGEPVLAARAGRIYGIQNPDTACGSSTYGGNIVWISHLDSVLDSTTPRPNGWRYVLTKDKYLHVAPNVPVKLGDQVAQGQVIAYNSCTGTGYPHVHFEVNIQYHEGRFPWQDSGYTFESVPMPFVETNDHLYGLPEKGDVLVSQNEKVIGIEQGGGGVLQQNGPIVLVSPNPFNSSTTFKINCRLQIVACGLKIYDINGKMADDLTSKIKNQQSSILNQIIWHPSNLPAGIYILKARIGNKTLTKRLFLCK
jgi:murein DD-endopeptidase MepM/ murein hydrolase activator NlpD